MKTMPRHALLLAALLLASCRLSQMPGNIDTPATPPETPEEPTTPPVLEAPQGLWLKGDLHVHDDHSSDGSLLRQLYDDKGPGNVSVADQIGQGELRLDWMPLTDHRTYDQHYDPLWESSVLLLVPGEEANGSPHSTVQGAVDTIVQGAGRPDVPDYINLQQSIWDAHSQGASWSIAHPDDGELEDDLLTPNVRANAQGMDTIETWNRGSNAEKEIDYAENRWNRGWRFGMGGGSDDHFKELWPITPPGSPLTAVFARDRSERGILQGLHGARTSIRLTELDPFVTLEADMQGDDIYEAINGDEVTAAAGAKGRLRVHVQNGLGATVYVYKSPGRSAGEFASFTPLGLDNTFTVDITAEEQPTWYRVEVRGVGQPATVDTNAIKDLPSNPTSLPALLASLTQNTANALRGVCSPIFIATAPVDAQPEIPLPADQGADDGAARTIGLQGLYSGFADLAVAEGVTHTVAETHAAAATGIVYRRGVAASVILSGNSTSARFPRIAARGDDVWVTWQDERAGQVPRRPAIYLRHSADSGQTWEAEQQVRAIDGRSEQPVIALTADGLPALAWREISAGNPFDVMFQVIGRDAEPVNLSREGKSVNPATILDTRSARYPASVWPSLTVKDDGSIAVAWQDNRTDADPLWTGAFPSGEGTDPDNWQIMTRTLPAGASAWTAPVSIGADDMADRHPSIAWAGNTLVAAWDSKELRSSGANLAVLAASSTDGGQTWSTPAAIAPVEQGQSQYPRLGRDGADVRAVWYDSRAADWRWRVMTAKFSGGGWSGQKMIMSRGVNTWPATDAGVIVFSSTRNAKRLQRDRTQQIFTVAAP